MVLSSTLTAEAKYINPEPPRSDNLGELKGLKKLTIFLLYASLANLLAISMLVTLPVTANSDTPLFSDNREMPYDTWLDARNLYGRTNSTHLYLKIDHYGNIPNTGYHTFGADIYLDTDQNGADDYYIFSRMRGYGGGWGRLYILPSYVEVVDSNLTISGLAGGDYIQIELPLSEIGNSTVMDIQVNNVNYLWDYVHGNFTYTIGNNTAIAVDGDSSDWAGTSTSFSDPNEGMDPSEFDLTDFYTTDNGTMLFHRFDVAGTPTTQISGVGSTLSRGDGDSNFLYDVDRDNTTGWSWQGMGLDYYVEVRTEATSSGKASFLFLYRWVNGSWEYVKDLETIDYQSVFELGVPLADLGVSTGNSIDILVDRAPNLGGFEFHDNIPDTGTVVVPELPSFLILPLLMITTLFAVCMHACMRYREQTELLGWI